MSQRQTSTRYERRRIAREVDNQRRLMGETLAAYHAREVAAPPTLCEIYEANRRNRERCMMTLDLFKESK